MGINDPDIETTCYLQVVPTFSRYRKDPNGEYEVDTIAVKAVTQSRPRTPVKNGVTVKVKFRFPKSAFKPLAPAVLVIVPEGMVVTAEDIVAEVEDANDA